MIVDKLYDRLPKKAWFVLDWIPIFLTCRNTCRKRRTAPGKRCFYLIKAIIDATEDVAGCYKVQIAYYESLGLEGMEAYRKTLAYLREKKLISIADIKRGDIAKTAEMYAKGHFERGL